MADEPETFDYQQDLTDDQPEGLNDAQPQGLGLGNVITQKLTEQIQNMDIMSVLQKLVATKPEDEESETVRQKLQTVIDQFQSMDPEQKEQFTKKIKEGLANKISARLQDPNTNLNLNKLEEAISEAVMSQLYLYGAAFVIFIILLVFFGYKLYKSIKDKEKRKEEKKKAKQMKKKK